MHRRSFTIEEMKRRPLLVELVLVGAFNQEKARGLLRDCENFADGSFAALINTVDKQYEHAVRLSLVCCVWGRPCSLIILNLVWTPKWLSRVGSRWQFIISVMQIR